MDTGYTYPIWGGGKKLFRCSWLLKSHRESYFLAVLTKWKWEVLDNTTHHSLTVYTTLFSGFMYCHFLPRTSASAFKHQSGTAWMFLLKCQSRCLRDGQQGGRWHTEMRTRCADTQAPSDGVQSRRPCGDRHSTLWPCTELTRPDVPPLNMCESALWWAQLL